MLTLFSQEYAREMELLAERKEAEAIGLIKGKAEGRAEGRAEGKAEGIEKGINYISQLMNALLSANRVEDAMRASTDSAYRSQLMAEFGLA